MAFQLLTQDHYSISDAPISLNKLDEFYDKTKVNDAEGTVSTVLNVVIDATRSGSIVNKRMYTAKSVERKHKRFTTPNMKPVLKNHEGDNVDAAIGRVTDATFERIAKTDDQFYNDFKYAKKGAEGSGKVMLDISIIDQVAQQKVIDKRYLTVSTGQQLGAALCSHCLHDWAADGPCNHWPGENCALDEKSPFVVSKIMKANDKMQAFLIGDIEDYNEVSFVNTPAQSLAKVTKIKDALVNAKLSVNDMTRLCDIFISDTYTRSRDCVYDAYMQDTNGFTQSLLLDDYRDHQKRVVTGKTTVDVCLPAANSQQDLSDNKAKIQPLVDSNQPATIAADSLTTTNMENSVMADPIKPADASAATEILAKQVKDLELAAKVNKEALDASNAIVDKLTAEKAALVKAVVDSQAATLLTMRKVTNHLETEGLDADKETKYLDSLKARSIESLKDAVADETRSFLKVINDLKKDVTANAAKPVIDAKVEAKVIDTAKVVKTKDIL